DGAGDGVTEATQIVVLQRSAGGVPAGDSRDELNDQIDDRFHGASLSLAARCCCPRLPISPHASPVCRVLRASSARVLSVGSAAPGARPPVYTSASEAVPALGCMAWFACAYADDSAQRMRHAKCITTP